MLPLFEYQGLRSTDFFFTAVVFTPVKGAFLTVANLEGIGALNQPATHRSADGGTFLAMLRPGRANAELI